MLLLLSLLLLLLLLCSTQLAKVALSATPHKCEQCKQSSACCLIHVYPQLPHALGQRLNPQSREPSLASSKHALYAHRCWNDDCALCHRAVSECLLGRHFHQPGLERNQSLRDSPLCTYSLCRASATRVAPPDPLDEARLVMPAKPHSHIRVGM